MTREEIEMEIIILENQIADCENQIFEYEQMLNEISNDEETTNE